MAEEQGKKPGDRKRLFFALWPSEEVRKACADLLRGRLGGKRVRAANLHVTLVFLGSLDKTQQAAVSEAAGRIAMQPFALSFDRLSFWKKPGVLCLEATQAVPALSNLVAQLNAAAGLAEITVDERPYRPHVTLLRKAGQALNLEFQPVEWPADGFCLVESCSTPYGVEYRVLQRWPAGA